METKPKISIVVAVSRQNAIGRGNNLLFRISDDLKRFKALTKGHPVIMGRKTYESIGRPLPERTNIIITRNPEYKTEGCIVASSLEDAIRKASSPPLLPSFLRRERLEGGSKEGLGVVEGKDITTPPSAPLLRKGGEGKNEIFIIGGGEIFKQALPIADKLYLTIVESDAEGDVFFPDWRKDFTEEVFREERVDPKTGLKYTWIDLEREH